MSYHMVINKGATRWPNAIKKVPIDKKNMYCCRFLKQLYGQKYIINIDEAGFGKLIKENYSWLPRGWSASIVNDIFKGRSNLILGISHTGDYLGLITNRNVSSTDYWLYLVILAKVLRSCNMNIQNDVILIQD